MFVTVAGYRFVGSDSYAQPSLSIWCGPRKSHILTKELLTYVCPEGLVPPTFNRCSTHEKDSLSQNHAPIFDYLRTRRRRSLDGFNFVGSGSPSRKGGKEHQHNSDPDLEAKANDLARPSVVVDGLHIAFRRAAGVHTELHSDRSC